MNKNNKKKPKRHFCKLSMPASVCYQTAPFPMTLNDPYSQF